MSRRALLPAALALGLAGCAALGRIIDDLGTERPPAPLERATLASDARFAPSGALAGSFVGEGTNRAVHLLSSDSALIAALADRVQPSDRRRGEPWSWLTARGTVDVPLDPVRDSALLSQPALAGSPAGHTPVRLEAILLHGSRCGAVGPQAELIVRGTGRGSGPSLRGPALGAFFAPGDYVPSLNKADRQPLPEPAPALTDTLLAWTRAAMDSLAAARLPDRDLPLATVPAGWLDLNGLADVDAADLQPFRLDDGRVRYAVSLRERRRTARGTDVVAAIVMAWDSAGAWRQVIFRPTVLRYRRGRLQGAHNDHTLPLFWRRLQPVSGFAYRRDYLWMEQVDAETGQVLWVILEPRGNTVVAAAAMDGPC